LIEDNLGKLATEKVEPIWILMKQEMMGWQRHQLDHMQIICTSLQTDNHASISSISYRPDDLPDAPQSQSTEANHQDRLVCTNYCTVGCQA